MSNERQNPQGQELQEKEANLEEPVAEPTATPSDRQAVESVGLIPEVVLEQLPQSQQDLVRQFSASVSQVQVPVPHPLYAKVTEEHITQSLVGVEQDRMREYAADSSRRRYQFMYFLVSLLALGALIGGILTFATEDLLFPILGAVGTFLGGMGLTGWLQARR